MRTLVACLILVGSLTSALADPIVFTPLTSTNNSVLLTNAEFRSTFGRKVIFKAGDGLESYDFTQLNPSVLARLNLDPAKMAGDQSSLDAKNKAYSQESQAYLSQQAQANAAAAAANAANTNTASASSGGNSSGDGTNAKHKHKKQQQ